ncbi:MAG: thioredoxin domain-containing protein, partial [Enterococcus aquimarinus]
HEAQAASIQFVPTLLLDDHIFDESITTETLASYLK